MAETKRVLVKIGQVAEECKVPISKLNFYLGRDLIRHVKKTKSGQRLFDLEEMRDRLARISQLRNASKSIDEIKKLLNRRRRQ